ncbi:DNA polymerase III delta prime subunit HolB [Psychroflexus torquis ATCC 700755]|uniref:DNA polymerase III delta prime subunit HolB n=1 Tax=Psychroflexus torquis (strain ATCC 700755 / CIP 106069 / ACAM 623) TaxID=313595 RepID=K4IFW8_PSYTT|nr:DNA polymerase III subunit delta' [Psychroflexus torquis]AFU68713.1 DNA polymerase III delta prime subunit HolB [Psychroflexus torquis ATCC 700755]
MRFEDILGLQHLKNHLVSSVQNNRVAHAQLFTGSIGSGTLPMAIAFARTLMIQYSSPSKGDRISRSFDQLTHPDLHFVYPINTTSSSSKKPNSLDFIYEWRSFVSQNPYQSLYDWYQKVGIEKKQGNINVDEAAHIVKLLSLKSFEGGPKVMIIWCADKMNSAASNKLLKLIEEPPNNTYFILITDSPEDILQTIRSRCQRLDFPPIGEADIIKGLVSKFDITESEALKIAYQADGSFSKALHLVEHNSDDELFEEWFITWVRSAFRAKGNKHVLTDLLDWSDQLSKETRETQKRFLNYCIQFFRQALLSNYKVDSLVYLSPYNANFKFNKFSEFISGSNITDIFKVLEDAIFHVERNGNGKVIFSDLSFQLTRLLHKK